MLSCPEKTTPSLEHLVASLTTLRTRCGRETPSRTLTLISATRTSQVARSNLPTALFPLFARQTHTTYYTHVAHGDHASYFVLVTQLNSTQWRIIGASSADTVTLVRKQGHETVCVTLPFSGEAPSTMDLKRYVGVKHALVSIESCEAFPLRSCKYLCCLAP